MESTQTYKCPYCGSKLKLWQSPGETTWGADAQYICFNDECNYYVNGWDWMASRYNVKASYRYRLNPVNNESGPIPVWSPEALKVNIIEKD